MNLSLFIPVYNEEKIVEENLKKISSFFSKNFKRFEIVVVNDNSKDNTGKIIESLSKTNKNLKHKLYKNGPSRRENLAEAMKKAKYDFVGYMDLDLATPLPYFMDLKKEIQSGADIAIGSRRIKNSKVKRSLYRNAWSFLYHHTVRLLFNSHIKDYQCGCKIFKKKVFVKLANQIGYDLNFQRGWFWDAELLIAAEKAGFSIAEVPVNWKEGKKSSFNFLREIKVLVYILKLRFFKNEFNKP